MMNRSSSIVAIALVSLASLAFGSVACTAPQDDDADLERTDDTLQAASGDDAVTCKTITGRHDITVTQCTDLLAKQGCKAGAVVNGEMGCSTTGRPAVPGSDRPLGWSAGTAPREDVTCKTIIGPVKVTIPQCKTLLAKQGCKAGAVVNGEMGCSTAGDPVAPDDGNPDDLAIPAR